MLSRHDKDVKGYNPPAPAKSKKGGGYPDRQVFNIGRGIPSKKRNAWFAKYRRGNA